MQFTFTRGMLALGLLAAGHSAQAGIFRTIRATELSSKTWNDISRGVAQDLVIEFRQGDKLPIALRAEGDLIETVDVGPGIVAVRRGFWIRIEKDQVLLSLDGTHFNPVSRMVSGSFTAGATSDPPEGGAASAINLLFKAHLK